MGVDVRLKIEQTEPTNIDEIRYMLAEFLDSSDFEIIDYDSETYDFNFMYEGCERTLHIDLRYCTSTHLYQTKLRIAYFDKAALIIKKMMLEFNMRNITQIEYLNEGYYP